VFLVYKFCKKDVCFGIQREREDILIAYVKRERENKINCKLNYCVKKNLLSHMR